jgi:hypothetical protein
LVTRARTVRLTDRFAIHNLYWSRNKKVAVEYPATLLPVVCEHQFTARIPRLKAWVLRLFLV